ncbi:MAG: beta-galactosidase [Planctomycetota bacterium]|jgi:beta-galactosidase|nr:beta-galactosidase [Planctomycetota bacterium]
MRYPTVTETPTLLHGGDYNPDQWLHDEAVLHEDIRLMKLAGVSSVSLGIFAWAHIEPEEGRFTFDWLDAVIERLHTAGIRIFLATPSGAKPNWLALKHDQVRRVDQQGQREPQRSRHNHCYTSPIYREKTAIINATLAERYGQHPAVALWHLSNEYGGECHCDLCWNAFRDWLRERYNNDIEQLNQAWWARFWSHTFASFDQITALDGSVHGLTLDWKRFVTHQTTDFIRHEIASVRSHSQIPVFTNLMGFFPPLDYRVLAKELDWVSHDDYPSWHVTGNDVDVACHSSMVFDLMRGLKHGKPWLLMESTPCQTNWQPVSIPKRPGVHHAHAMLAVAHGSDSVCYFQWRKSRGSAEKFHGAVVDHVGHENTRVFREVAALGQELGELGAIAGSAVPAQAAVIYDWDNHWAIDIAQGPRNRDKNVIATLQDHYRPLWRAGIPCDVIGSTDAFDGYRLLIAPMLYMLQPGVAKRLEAFVEAGGTLLVTYLSGIANETDLVFSNGWPGPLRELLGIWVEEQDVLADHMEQTLVFNADNPLKLTGECPAVHYADVVHLEGASAAATYGSEYYAGRPALTRKESGAGEAWYCATRLDHSGVDSLVSALATRAGLKPALESLPDGVHVTIRQDDTREWLFVFNFSGHPRGVILPDGLRDARTAQPITDLDLAGYEARVLVRDG